MAKLLLQFLNNNVAEESQALYSECFLQRDLVVALLSQPPEALINFVTRGFAVAVPWTSTRAAVKIMELTALSYVATLKSYNSSPGRDTEPGRRDPPGEAQNQDGTLSFRAGYCLCFLPRVASLPLFAPAVG